MPFFQISLKNSELKTTHNTFQDCRMQSSDHLHKGSTEQRNLDLKECKELKKSYLPFSDLSFRLVISFTGLNTSPAIL